MPRTAAKPRRPEKPPAALLPTGTVLMHCTIPQRAVPWKAATVTRRGAFKDRRLVKWQADVALMAALAYGGRVPYGGPVEVFMVARFGRGPMGDATNLLKSAEDALQGVVFANDRQVIRNSCERSIAGHDLVSITVKAAEPTED